MAYSKSRGTATRGKSYKKPKARTKAGWPDVRQKGPWKPGGPFPGAATKCGSGDRKCQKKWGKDWKKRRKHIRGKKWPRTAHSQNTNPATWFNKTKTTSTMVKPPRYSK